MSRDYQQQLPFPSVNLTKTLGRRNSDSFLCNRRTYNHVISVANYQNILHEREHDIKVAAEIGQALLDTNQNLQERIHELEHDGRNRGASTDDPDDVVNQFLRHELHQRQEEYVGMFTQDWSTYKKMLKRDRATHRAVVDEKNALESENIELERRVDVLQKQSILLNAMKQQAESDREEIDRLRSSLAKRQQQQSSSSPSLKKPIATHNNDRIIELEKELVNIRSLHTQALQKARQTNANRISELRTEIKIQKTAREKAESDLHDLHDYVDTIRAENEQLHRIHNEMNAKTMMKQSTVVAPKATISSPISVFDETKTEYYKEKYENVCAELEKLKKSSAVERGRDWFDHLSNSNNNNNTEWARVLTANTTTTTNTNTNHHHHHTPDRKHLKQQARLNSLKSKYGLNNANTSPYILDKHINGPVSQETAEIIHRWDRIWNANLMRK